MGDWKGPMRSWVGRKWLDGQRLGSSVNYLFFATQVDTH